MQNIGGVSPLIKVVGGKRLKKVLLCFLTVALALCACGMQKPSWPGYVGTLDSYEYCHTGERDRAWEEDILFLADKFLAGHPLIADDNFMNRVLTKLPSSSGYKYEYDYSNAMYNEAARQLFLEQINQLIPKIPELTDTEIIYEIQRSIALLGDGHSNIDVGFREIFPFRFDSIYDETGVSLYAVCVPDGHDNLLLGKLIAINDVPINEIIDKLSVYISHENAYWMIRNISNPFSDGLLTQKAALQIIGVVEPNATGAVFTFETEKGIEKYTVNALSSEEYEQTTMVSHPMLSSDSMMLKHDDNYWYMFLEEDHVMYIRFRKAHENREYTMSLFLADVKKLLRDSNEPIRLIIDFRNNSGGFSFTDEINSFISAVNQYETDGIYILINNGSYSSGVVIPYKLAEGIESAQLVGSPAGQYVNFFSTPNNYSLPNHGYSFGVSSVFLWGAQNATDTTLMPDIQVCQTLDDYRRNIDTVLEYVLALE